MSLYRNIFNKINNFLYSFLFLYKKEYLIINNSLFNKIIYIQSNMYLNYKKFFQFVIKFQYKNEYNLFDFYIREDFYRFKDFYKINYFIKTKKIVDFKHFDFLPNNNKNILFLN